jgi:diguanylate cyclase (GGDEF)-like protein
MKNVSSGASVLVVDDNPVNRQLISTLLKYQGHAIYEAADGREALRLAEQVHPKLIISDIVMPTMDGFTFIRHLRLNPELKHIEVIFYTAHYHEREAEALAAQCQVARVLIKPCEPREILNAVDQLLNQHEPSASAAGDNQAFDRQHLELITNKLAQKANELQSANARLQDLTELNLQLASERDPHALLRKVCYGARQLSGASFALLAVYEKNQSEEIFVASSGIEEGTSLPPPPLPHLDGGPLGRVVATGTAWRARASPTEVSSILPPGYPLGSAYLAAPVSSLDHRYGWLCLIGKVGGEEFNGDDERVLSTLGAQVGRIYENGSLYHAIRMHATQLQLEIQERQRAADRIRHLNRVYAVLSGINGLIVRAGTHAELFTQACRLAVEDGDFRFAWIGSIRSGRNRLSPAAWAGDDFLANSLGAAFGSPEAQRFLDQAGQLTAPHVCNDLTIGDELVPYAEDMVAQGYRSFVALPLSFQERLLGCMLLASNEVHSFDAAEMRLLEELAGDISFAIDHIEKAERLDYLAYYDALTGLANRKLLIERLAQRVNVSHALDNQFAVVVIDPERFDSLLDTFGRNHADTLLKELGDRLAGAVGNVSAVARVGASQFAAILPFEGDANAVAQLFETQSRDWLGSTYRIGDEEITIAAQSGVSLYPHDASDPETLLENAEIALKRARATGERVVFFTPQISERIAERRSLEGRLRRALENNEFVLYYQSKVDFEERRLQGVEALIRWQSPELGLVPPVKFIPLMEENGMIVEVGAWALRAAALERGGWLAQGLKAPRIAVNVSTGQIRRADFVAVVTQAISPPAGDAFEEGFDAGIDIEVTESLLMESVEDSIGKLRAIRGLGVGIAIDDFGTGYSSLSYLTRLPIQSVKIDRSFTVSMLDDPSAMTLVSTMITLAHSLKLSVIAEGTETEEQAKILRLLRCDQMQGYLIDRPMPAEALVERLRRVD